MDFCSVELLNRTSDEPQDRMLEERSNLDTAELGPDLKTVPALHEVHQHPERELASVEKDVYRVNQLADCVKSSYPNERKNMNIREKEIEDLSGKETAKTLCGVQCHRIHLSEAHQNFI
jgi:spectrin beta